MCVREISFIFPGDISLHNRRYYVGFLKVFDVCPEDIWWVSWIFLIGVMEIFDGCPGDI